MKTHIAINGACGRMGQRLVALSTEDPTLAVAAALDWAKHPNQGRDAGECPKDGFSDTARVVSDIIVPKPQNPEATRLQIPVAAFIVLDLFVCRVRRAVGLDDQSRIMTRDVGIVRPDEHLAPKMIALLAKRLNEGP